MRHFHAAPWPTTLKVVSFLGTGVLCALSYAAYRAVPTPSGFTHNFGIGVALVPLVIILGAVLFIVGGYRVDSNVLLVERLITSTSVPLAGLTRIWADPSICKGSLRVVGNGGLFSFTGWFQNKTLGRYRLFATDFRHAVVLKFPDRVVVVSPAAPQAFIDHLHHIIPDLNVGPEESGA